MRLTPKAGSGSLLRPQLRLVIRREGRGGKRTISLTHSRWTSSNLYSPPAPSRSPVPVPHPSTQPCQLNPSPRLIRPRLQCTRPALPHRRQLGPHLLRPPCPCPVLVRVPAHPSIPGPGLGYRTPGPSCPSLPVPGSCPCQPVHPCRPPVPVPPHPSRTW